MKREKSKGDMKTADDAQIQVDAYHRWVKRGAPEGDALTDWLAAEKQRRIEEEDAWTGEERRWEEKNPQDDEPGGSS